MAKKTPIETDLNETASRMRTRGLTGNIAFFAMWGTVAAGAVTANYVAPQVIDAVSLATEAELSLLSPEYRAVVLGGMIGGIDQMAADTSAVAGRVGDFFSSQADSIGNMSWYADNRPGLSSLEIGGMKVGETLVKVADWTMTSDPEASTMIGRYGRPLLGGAALLWVSALALKAGMAASMNPANLAASTLRLATHTAPKAVGSLAKSVVGGMKSAFGRFSGKGKRRINKKGDMSAKDVRSEVHKRTIQHLKEAGVDADAADKLASVLTAEIGVEPARLNKVSEDLSRVKGQLSEAIESHAKERGILSEQVGVEKNKSHSLQLALDSERLRHKEEIEALSAEMDKIREDISRIKGAGAVEPEFAFDHDFLQSELGSISMKRSNLQEPHTDVISRTTGTVAGSFIKPDDKQLNLFNEPFSKSEEIGEFGGSLK